MLSVAAAASSVSEYFCSSNKGPALERVRQLAARYFGMTAAQADEFLEQVKSRMEDAAGTFSVNADELGDPVDLMVLANEHLAKLALREHAALVESEERHQIAVESNAKLALENQQLQQQAFHDPLTKIYNRNYFEEALTREVQRCRRTAEPVAVIFSDLDNFKNLNDTYGHPFGDHVLREVAVVIQGVLRNSDVFARFGGEEFVVLAVGPTEKGLEKVVERIRAKVENHPIFFEGRRIPVTISIGSAIKIPRRNGEGTGERLIAEADEAMYQSKRAGRNRSTARCLLNEEERRLMQWVMQRRFSRWLVGRQVLDIPTVSQVILNCRTPRIYLGELARQAGCLDLAAVEQILLEQSATEERFGEAAVRLGLLTETQLAQLLAWQNEDPKILAQQLIRSGALSRPDAEMLLEQYFAETALRPGPLPEMELASFL